MFKTTNDTCYSGDLGDPEGDYADRFVRSYRTSKAPRPTCTEPGCDRQQTARGPRCMSCFMDNLLSVKGA
jgi:hypothetical protein